MAADSSALANELNKLKKSELIDLITLQKIPSNFMTSAVLLSFKTKLQVAVQNVVEIDNNVNLDVTDFCCKQSCIQLKISNETQKVKLEALNKLVSHLEGRLLDQQNIIALLKECKLVRDQLKDESSNTNKVLTTTPSSKGNNIVLNEKQKTYTVNKTTGNTFANTLKASSSIQTEKEEQKISEKITAEQVSSAIEHAQKTITNNSRSTTHRYHNNKNKPVIGKSNINIVKSVPKQGYLHVYRLHPDTTSDLLISFLKKSASSINFVCEKLDKRDNSTSSFKVCFPIADCDKVYDPSIWPDGAAVRRFKFPQNADRNFHSTASDNKKF